MSTIYDHTMPKYELRRLGSNSGRFNGAYYYSIEIVNNIIPRVKTSRPWVTVNQVGMAEDNAIVFVHNNKTPGRYDWLKPYKNLILVCGIPETVEKVAHLGKAVYLPISVDVEDVERYRVDTKDKDICYAGRPNKRHGAGLYADEVDLLENMPREELLTKLAHYKKAYAVGRCAIEAKILGCKILPYDKRFPDPSRWKIFDNKDAAVELQKMIDSIDGCKNHE